MDLIWTLRGRGPYHVPELDGPYLEHNVLVEVRYSESEPTSPDQLSLLPGEGPSEPE